MILLPVDSSHQDESNGMCFISLALILIELRRHKHLIIIGVGARSSDPISIILPPFDSSHQDESNGMRFISLASILTELRCHKHLMIKLLFIKAIGNIIRPKLRLTLAKYFRNTKLITELRN